MIVSWLLAVVASLFMAASSGSNPDCYIKKFIDDDIDAQTALSLQADGGLDDASLDGQIAKHIMATGGKRQRLASGKTLVKGGGIDH